MPFQPRIPIPFLKRRASTVGLLAVILLLTGTVVVVYAAGVLVGSRMARSSEDAGGLPPDRIAVVVPPDGPPRSTAPAPDPEPPGTSTPTPPGPVPSAPAPPSLTPPASSPVTVPPATEPPPSSSPPPPPTTPTEPSRPVPRDTEGAARALVQAVAAGDVGAVWDLLDEPARVEVQDQRGLSARLPELRARWAGVTPTVATVLATEVGSVGVVVNHPPPVGPGPTEIDSLAFRSGGDGFRLATFDPVAVTWSAPTPDEPSLTVTAPTRPVAVVINGAVWAAEPTPSTGLRVPTTDLPAGDHVAIAVVVDGDRVHAAAMAFTSEVPTPPEPPPTTSPPESAPPTTG